VTAAGNKDPRLYLIHTLECIAKIRSYTSEGREAFLASTLAHDAVSRNLQIIGEAAKRAAEDVRTMAPESPWRGIAGLRDVIRPPIRRR